MKWFKHDTDASNDPKIRKLKKKFGMAGYGVYFNLLELISRKMEDDIEHFGYLSDDWDDESLEIEFGLDTNTVRTMFDYLLEVGLFEKIDGKMYNGKIQGRCDDYTARLIRQSESAEKNVYNKPSIKKSTNTVRTKSDKVSLDKNRIDKNRIDKSIRGGVGEITPTPPNPPAIKKETPAEIMRAFITLPDKQEDVILWLISKKVPESIARREVKKFLEYWTEPTKSGKKQLWETKKTFELRRRLVTWFDRVRENQHKFNQPQQQEYDPNIHGV